LVLTTEAAMRAASVVPLGRRSALDERLPEQLDFLCGERLGLEYLERRDLAEDAERGLEIGILDDAEILPRAHDGEEALDSTALVFDDLVDLVEVLGVFSRCSRAIGASLKSPT
jgi:hypothetical protein